MYVLELHDILFLIKSLKTPTGSFNVYNHICFNDDLPVESYAINTLIMLFQPLHIFVESNVLPIIDLSLSFTTIKSKLYTYLWNYFLK